MSKRTTNRPKREYGVEMNCDICGKNNATAIAMVESAQVAVCKTCTKFGKVLHRIEDVSESEIGEITSITHAAEEEIIENYSVVIRKKREELRLPLAVVAERIGEKESFLEKVERGSLLPALPVAKKLEKELGIKLIEKVQGGIVVGGVKKTPFSEPSLADILEASKKTKK